jgi:hypothetical protein
MAAAMKKRRSFRQRFRGWQPRELMRLIRVLVKQQRQRHSGREAAKADQPLAKRKARNPDRFGAQIQASPAVRPVRR